MIKKENYLVLLVLLTFVFFSCDESEFDIDAPNCIENKINVIKSEPIRNPPTQVWTWDVDSETYYYFTSNCCDQYNYLYDKNCNQVCAPDGGITGAGDGNCPTFSGEITKTLIWEDGRN